MRYGIFYKENHDDINELKSDLLTILAKEIHDDKNPEYLFVLGGDGTFLNAIHAYEDKLDKIKFVVFKKGNISFFSNYEVEDLYKIHDMIKQSYIRKLPLLEVNIDDTTIYAANEIAVGSFNKAIDFSVLINNKYLERYQGQGLLVATNFGSSAYNKAFKGAIIDHSLDAYVFTEMGAINSSRSKSIGTSIVLNSNRILKLRKENDVSLTVSYDTKNATFDDVKEITIRLSEKKITVLCKQEDIFVNKIHSTFIK